MPFCFRLSSKPHGAMNGDIYDHIDQELEILNSGKTICLLTCTSYLLYLKS